MLEYLRKQRADLRAQLDDARRRCGDTIAEARSADRTLSPEEKSRFDSARRRVESLTADLREMDQEIERAAEDERRSGLLAAARRETGGQSGTERSGDGGPEARWYVGSETYRRGDPARSWIRDQIAVVRHGDTGAMERLHANNREVYALPEYRAQSTTDGAGGDFVPPLWLVNQFIALARATRTTANLLNNVPLPAGTDSINVPKIATGTAVATQATQNTVIQNTDATTGAATGAVQTIAGGQTLSVQMIEQSPINLDEVYLADLLADLAAKVDLFVLNNAVTNALGLLQLGGTNAVTYTSASPTLATLYPKLADARQRIEVNRFASPTAIVMNPRRWAWELAAIDTANRPMVVPNTGGPYNSAAVQNTTPNQRGYVGDSLGLPVFLDPLVPTNLGAGTNEDRIIVAKFDDSWLYESTPKAEVFREPKADQMSVYLRVYEYAAIIHRYPAAISIIAGTGLVTPTF